MPDYAKLTQNYMKFLEDLSCAVSLSVFLELT